MIKKTFILALLLSLNGLAHAQQFSAKDLMGRWQTKKNGQTNDLIILSDTMAASTSANGLLHNYLKYTTKVRKDIIDFTYTVDINRAKHPNHSLFQIKFLNDTTFLMKPVSFISWKADTAGKKDLRVYHKIKTEKPGTALHNATYKNIQGVWTNFFKDKLNDVHIIFRDSRRAEFSMHGQAGELVYTADFTKQPIPLDLYYPGTQKTLQAFLAIEGDNNLWIEFFPNNNRGDHFTMFGHNTSFVRDTTLKPHQ